MNSDFKLSKKEIILLIKLANEYNEIVGFLPAPGAVWRSKESEDFRKRSSDWESKVFGNEWYTLTKQLQEICHGAQFFFLKCQHDGFKEALLKTEILLLRDIIDIIKR